MLYIVSSIVESVDEIFRRDFIQIKAIIELICGTVYYTAHGCVNFFSLCQ